MYWHVFLFLVFLFPISIIFFSLLCHYNLFCFLYFPFLTPHFLFISLCYHIASVLHFLLSLPHCIHSISFCSLSLSHCSHVSLITLIFVIISLPHLTQDSPAGIRGPPGGDRRDSCPRRNYAPIKRTTSTLGPVSAPITNGCLSLIWMMCRTSTRSQCRPRNACEYVHEGRGETAGQREWKERSK